MPLLTHLLEFRINQNTFQLTTLPHLLLSAFETINPEFIGTVTVAYTNPTSAYMILDGPRGSLITAKCWRQSNSTSGTVSVNVEYFLEDGENTNERPLLSYQDTKDLELIWGKKAAAHENESLDSTVVAMTPKTWKTVPRILRSIPFDIYFPASDGRLLEYDVDSLLFDSKSEFQHVQVLHSKTHGNMLVLDDDPNLAESDSIYTSSLLRLQQGGECCCCYANKEILVLGGGDGAALQTLLTQNPPPKKVTMVEIDPIVMEAARTHLRSLCGDSLDNLIGHNKEIILGDCLVQMERMKNQGLQFDYIVGDLTTVPIDTISGISAIGQPDSISGNSGICQPESDQCSLFLRQVLTLSFQILRPDGKYLTHAPGLESGISLEKLLEGPELELPPGVDLVISKSSAFVPSFHENWTFYQIINRKK